MNVWHVVTSEYPPDVGGVSDYTGQLAGALAAAGDEVHVWCPGGARPDAGGVHVHPELGRIGRADLARVDAMLARFPGPRRLFVQWVPHGFGYHSMNVWFCVWLARRARAGDQVELMVHEPYLEFAWGSPKHLVMACVHRMMTLVLLASARRAWIAIPAWEGRLRPYALGRQVPMTWLPIPGCVPSSEPAAAALVRLRYAPEGEPIVGHFGSYGAAVSLLLEERLPPVMDGPHRPRLLLLGAGSEAHCRLLLSRHPAWAGRVHAAGYLDAAALGAHLAACDVFLQPYPDGVTSRRTSVMACLSQGRAVVTTAGHLTERLWAESGAVALADVDDAGRFVECASTLLGDGVERDRLGDRGRRLYSERFSVDRVVTTLRAA